MTDCIKGLRHPVAWWAIGGVLLILGNAVVRLSTPAWAPIAAGQLETIHVVAYVLSVVIMIYSEGYRGFHQKFSPRVVVRGALLPTHGQLVHKILAPAFAMGLVGANRKRTIVSWMLTSMIVLLIIGVRMLPPVWRGAVDAGVVAGLAFGSASILLHLFRAWSGHPPEMDADLAESIS